MPFQSESQKRWMYANKPDMAKEWQSKTSDSKKLPEYVSKARKSVIDKRKWG